MILKQNTAFLSFTILPFIQAGEKAKAEPVDHPEDSPNCHRVLHGRLLASWHPQLGPQQQQRASSCLLE